MTEAPFAKEDFLQELVEKYPDLLAGDQMDSTESRRWLLVARELGVPDDEGAADSVVTRPLISGSRRHPDTCGSEKKLRH